MRCLIFSPFIVCLIFACLYCGAVGELSAQSVVQGEQPISDLPHRSNGRSDRDSLIEIAVKQRNRIQTLESNDSAVFLKLQNCDVGDLGSFVEQLIEARNGVGFISDLPRQALRMTEIAAHCASIREFPASEALAIAAEQLAPNSYAVTRARSGLKTSDVSGAGLLFFKRTVANVISDPLRQLWILGKLIYPTLISLSLALHLTLLFLVARLVTHADSSGKSVSIIVAAAVIAIPILGILWGSVLLSLVLMWGVRQGSDQRTVATAVKIAGVTLILWGSAIPLREQISSWSSNSYSWTIGRAIVGEFISDEKPKIELCNQLVDLRAEDWRMALWCAQLLRVEGKFSAATAQLTRAEPLIRSSHKRALPELLNSKALVALGSRDNNAAQLLLDEAEEIAAEDWRLMWNQSVLAFQKADIAKSNAYLARARAINPSAIEFLQSREAELGVGHPVAMANFEPNLATVWQSIVVPDGIAADRVDSVARSIMYFATPPAIGGLGVLLFISGLVAGLRGGSSSIGRSSKKRPSVDLRTAGTFKALQILVPGYRLLNGGHCLAAVLSNSILIALLMLLSGWSADFVTLRSVLRVWISSSPVVSLATGIVAYLALSVFAYRVVADRSIPNRPASDLVSKHSIVLGWMVLVLGIALPIFFGNGMTIFL